jgi:hypothetical protein
MSIPYQSTTVVLQGILTQLNEGTLVQVFHLTEANLGLEQDDKES